MLVRNLDYLSIPKEFKKVETNIYDNKSIALVFVENKGYSLVLKDDEHIDSVFLLKTSLTPNNINENNDKEDFINVIKILLEKVYSEYTIKEYEKQHQEHVFLRLMDMLTDGDNIELISEENSKIYSDIEKGFMKLELDIMDTKINSLNESIADVSNNLQHTVKDIEEKDWGNKLKKALDSQ